MRRNDCLQLANATGVTHQLVLGSRADQVVNYNVRVSTARYQLGAILSQNYDVYCALVEAELMSQLKFNCSFVFNCVYKYCATRITDRNKAICGLQARDLAVESLLVVELVFHFACFEVG